MHLLITLIYLIMESKHVVIKASAPALLVYLSVITLPLIISYQIVS